MCPTDAYYIVTSLLPLLLLSRVILLALLLVLLLLLLVRLLLPCCCCCCLCPAGDKPVVVDFMAGWCGKCRMIAPFVDELAVKHPGLVGHIEVLSYY